MWAWFFFSFIACRLATSKMFKLCMLDEMAGKLYLMKWIETRMSGRKKELELGKTDIDTDTCTVTYIGQLVRHSKKKNNYQFNNVHYRSTLCNHSSGTRSKPTGLVVYHAICAIGISVEQFAQCFSHVFSFSFRLFGSLFLYRSLSLLCSLSLVLAFVCSVRKWFRHKIH